MRLHILNSIFTGSRFPFFSAGPVSLRINTVFAFFLIALVGYPKSGFAQVSFTGTYLQNFDAMGTGSAIPAGWSHIGKLGGTASSWTTSIPASGSPSAASSGTVNNSLIVATNTFTGTSNTRAFNYSDANSSDRALGTSPTSGAGNILQLILNNNTGIAVSTLQLGYSIRRFANATSAETIPGYRLFVSVNGGSSWTSVAALNPTISTLPNTVGTSNFNLVLALPAPVQVAGQVRFRWVDDNSASSTVDQRIGLDNVSITLSPTTACGTPAGQFASGITTTSANLAWLAVPGANSYNLRWRALSSANFTNVNGLTSTSYTLAGLQASSSYEFQVQAVCSSGTGNFAPATTFFTPAGDPPCAAANNLNAANITSTSALLSWSAGGPGSDYFILFWKPVSASTFNSQNNLQSLSWQLNGLTPGTNYVYQVQTICGAVAGEPAIPAELSAPFFFTTASTQRAGNPFINIKGEPTFTVWPNPNSGGQLDISLDQLDSELDHALVELIDPHGKRSATFTLPTGNGLLRATLELPRDLADGLYMLKVYAGARQFSQRLVIY